MQFMAEQHMNLRNGNGLITTHTKILKKWYLFGGPSPRKQFTRFQFDPKASIGLHQHKHRSEIYFTLSRHIRFNDKKYWLPINICLKGGQHKAENISNESTAKMYALSF